MNKQKKFVASDKEKEAKTHLFEEQINMGALDNIECACHSIDEHIYREVVVCDGFDGGVDKCFVEVEDECLSFEVGRGRDGFVDFKFLVVGGMIVVLCLGLLFAGNKLPFARRTQRYNLNYIFNYGQH